jgi:nucleoside-diphosphate-sugar epimerase
LKILLTGASGFVGSHILDSIRSRDLSCVLLVRSGSSKRFLSPHLDSVEMRLGDFSRADALVPIMAGITHVIHCAGCIRALTAQEFYAGNRDTTRNLVTAANQAGVQRFVHISSLAAMGPAWPGQAGEGIAQPRPVSEYGRSKLAGEMEVRNGFRREFVILRPPAVYGPRDAEFLRLFRAAKHHLIPGSRQDLSLVYVRDLAEVAVECLFHPAAPGAAWFVATPEVVTVLQMGRAVAALQKVKALTVPFPKPLQFVLCAAGQFQAWLTRRPSVLSLQKYAELREPRWVGDPVPLRRELGLECRTTMQEGLRQTLAWYVENGWL